MLSEDLKESLTNLILLLHTFRLERNFKEADRLRNDFLKSGIQIQMPQLNDSNTGIYTLTDINNRPYFSVKFKRNPT